MTKRTARNIFFLGTLVCMAVFLGLTVHTMSTIPEFTHSEALTAEVVAGKKVWEKHDCIGCHTLIGEGSYYAPELKDVYSRKGPAYLRAFLKDPVAVWFGGAEAARGRRKMPNLHLTDTEIERLIAFLAWVDRIDTHGWPPRAEAAEAPAPEASPAAAADAAVERGRALVQAKGCASCHRIAGAGGTVGPDLTGVGARLDRETLRRRLRDPQSVNPDSIMPNFHFTEDQIEDLAAYLETL